MSLKNELEFDFTIYILFLDFLLLNFALFKRRLYRQRRLKGVFISSTTFGTREGLKIIG
jgi:hypothetical protein